MVARAILRKPEDKYTIVQGPTKFDLQVAFFDSSDPTSPRLNIFITKDGKRDTLFAVQLMTVTAVDPFIREEFLIEGNALKTTLRELVGNLNGVLTNSFRVAIRYKANKKTGTLTVLS